MYHHYDECHTPCARQKFNVMGTEVEVEYYHLSRDGVDIVFVNHPCFHEVGDQIYAGSTMDVAWRGALMSQAGIEAVWHVHCGGFPFGDENLIYVSNDWHTGLLPVYLKAFYQDHLSSASRARCTSSTTSPTRAGPTPRRSGASVSPTSTPARSTSTTPRRAPA